MPDYPGRATRARLDRSTSRGGSTSVADHGPVVGKRTLTEGVAAGYGHGRRRDPAPPERFDPARGDACETVAHEPPTRGSLTGNTLLAAGRWDASPSSGEGGGVRHPVVGDVDTLCVGEAFARDLSDEALEQTIEYLIARRDRADLAATDREVTVENLAALAAESARRGRSSHALDRDAVRTLMEPARHEEAEEPGAATGTPDDCRRDHGTG